ncbi:hypothetical protein NIES2100_11200 [Calothrix sp. NIES-2100]|uniref:DUF4232 domain-containing protein n=1 Tax=Calothrix sp. NIES-2100 TaxID=1954172 RepID=UPI000B5F0857|nr:hypothetical protein NIES2100_11200 [Calothrix sp. NIES-2100]
MKLFRQVFRGLIIDSGGRFLIFTVLITGCANSTSATKQEQPKPAITNNSSPKTNSASNPPRCQTEQLSVSKVSANAGAGNVAIIYAFTNKGSSPCNLYGYPGFALLDSKDQPLKEVKVIRTPRQQSPQQVTLPPNGQASFDIAYNQVRDVGQSCPTSVKIEITPPNAYNHFTLPETINACTGKVRVRPVQSGIIQ